MKDAETKAVDLPMTQQSVRNGDVEDPGMTEKPLPPGHDDALELFNDSPESFVYSAKEANRVRMKLDFILLPMVSLLL